METSAVGVSRTLLVWSVGGTLKESHDWFSYNNAIICNRTHQGHINALGHEHCKELSMRMRLIAIFSGDLNTISNYLYKTVKQ